MTGETNSSSTSEEMARALFQQTIVPAAERIAPRRLLAAEPLAADSYFAAPTRPTLSLLDMESSAGLDALDELARIWQAQGFDDLLPLIGGFVEIRDKCAAAPARDGGGIPELIYTLY